MNLPAFWHEIWAAGWFGGLVNHLWQSTVVVAIGWLLTLALRKNQARTRYWVWIVASAKFLLPFSLLIDAGEWARSLFAAPPVAQPALAAAMEQVAQPFPQAQFFGAAEPSVAAQRADLLPAILLAIWACGALIVLFRWTRGWMQIRAAVRAASPIELAADVPVLSTTSPIEPGIFGILRPVLLLPEGILNRLTPAQLDAIVAHEMCHVRRRDNLTFAFHMIVEALFWFHPAVWWIGARLIEERERACDEAVVQSGGEAEIYAEGILSVCKLCVESPLPCVSGVTGSELKQRIFRIMTKHAALKLDLSRKLLLSIVGIAAISAPVTLGMLHITELRAQSAPANPARSIAATWQGTLHTNRNLRFVIKITDAGDGTLRATFYNLDAEPGGTPAISTTLNGFLLKLELPFGTYEGTMSADGNSIAGTWRQGPNALPLIFARATPETAWTIPQPPLGLPPMAADANPTFEVAAIKLSRPDEHGPRFWFENRRFSVTHTSLSYLVKFAYGLEQRQIVGAPDWFSSEWYDISAEPDGEGEPSFKQWQSMVERLMADRFQLKFHWEKRELPVYALTVAKTGPKLTKDQRGPGVPGGMGFGPPGNCGGTNQTMADFAEAMGQAVLDRPVVDQTGLTGRFDFRLRWTPDEMQSATEGADAPPDLFAAIQEELGLKLVSTKAPVEVMVIDHVEQPSPN
ncbi:MAG: M56 family metallopeptidase [Terracidiphilus sp.]